MIRGLADYLLERDLGQIRPVTCGKGPQPESQVTTLTSQVD